MLLRMVEAIIDAEKARMRQRTASILPLVVEEAHI
ncbi:unnamed protein product [Rhodiola kirilowii]